VTAPPEELKTSYYTGPNENALRPLKLRTALAFDAIADNEVRPLAQLEIQTTITRYPALKDCDNRRLSPWLRGRQAVPGRCCGEP